MKAVSIYSRSATVPSECGLDKNDNRQNSYHMVAGGWSVKRFTLGRKVAATIVQIPETGGALEEIR